MFHFAWVDASETIFGPQHLVEDEKVLSFAIEHSEGDFASLSVVIKNPRIGLLAPARKTWAWLSHGSTPLFFGRLVGVPSSINQNAVTLEFIARPADYAAQKEALAITLRTLPYYDPVFLTPEAQVDPDTVLEARPELWHIDRTTLAVTTSHILVGEDGVEEFYENEVPYDSVAISIGRIFRERGIDVSVGQAIADRCGDLSESDCGALKRSGVALHASLSSIRICDLACVLILAGGVRRTLPEDTTVLIQSTQITNRLGLNVSEESREGLHARFREQIKLYFTQMGVDPALADTIDANYESARNTQLSRADVVRFRIVNAR